MTTPTFFLVSLGDFLEELPQPNLAETELGEQAMGSPGWSKGPNIA